MRVAVQPLWRQKHPSPSSASWDFHWHPRGLPAEVTAAIASMDVGLTGAQAAWIVAPGFAMWARTFAAQAPSEQRAYLGLAGAVARWDGDAADALPSVFEALGAVMPPARPAGDGAVPAEKHLEARPAALLDPTAWGSVPRDLAHARALAEAVVRGGRVRMSGAADDALPALFGRLLSWLPPADRAAPRTGTLEGGGPRLATQQPEVENLLHYLALAWAPPAELARRAPGRARATFQAIHEAAAASGRPLADLFGELGTVADAWSDGAHLARWLRGAVITDAEARACDAAAPAPLFDANEKDAGLLWGRVLAYYGRGLLAGDGLAARLGAVLARRVIVDHLVALDEPARADLPQRYVRRLELEALLPRTARVELRAALAQTAPSLVGGAA